MTKQRELVFLQKPSVSGPIKILIGKQEFGVPEGTKIHWLDATRRACWIMLPSGGIRCLGSGGEAEVPTYLSEQVAEKYFATDVEIRDD